jgi:hypothetical protein
LIALQAASLRQLIESRRFGACRRAAGTPSFHRSDARLSIWLLVVYEVVEPPQRSVEQNEIVPSLAGEEFCRNRE